MIRRVLIAPDSFKGSLTAEEAARSMRDGLTRAGYTGEVDLCPLADGGEGFMQPLAAALGGAWRRGAGSDPLGRAFVDDAGLPQWLHVEDQGLAVFELATHAGLPRLRETERDPTRTTTYGFGQMVADALGSKSSGKPITQTIMGIGGSATNDGGCGAAQALGVRFYDGNGALLSAPITGGDLPRIQKIDLAARHPVLDDLDLRVACDVTNPMTGPNGAARVYAPQKGATPEQVAHLERGMRGLAERFREDCGVDVENLPGAGAAGGFGGGAVALLGAVLEPGIDVVLQAVGFAERLAACDLCLTGEGCLDGQSGQGKVVGRLVRACQARAIPCLAVAGSYGDGWQALPRYGLSDQVEAGRGVPQAQAMLEAASLVTAATQRIISRWLK